MSLSVSADNGTAKNEKTMSKSIDLNADLGEGSGADAELLAIVTSCNIACGGHAGDDASMRETASAAQTSGVVVGAHPSYPDREGFGRRSHFLTGDSLLESLINQLHDLEESCNGLGVSIRHVKPHGALYNDAADDPALASIIVKSINELSGRQSLVGPPQSELSKAAELAHLSYTSEAFADRSYLANGRLVARSVAGAVHTDIDAIKSQAVSIVVDHCVCLHNGEFVQVTADTLCVHGDTPGAVAAASRIRDVLENEGVQIRAVES
jgi:UPF0271 protein